MLLKRAQGVVPVHVVFTGSPNSRDNIWLLYDDSFGPSSSMFVARLVIHDHYGDYTACVTRHLEIHTQFMVPNPLHHSTGSLGAMQAVTSKDRAQRCCLDL